MKKISKMTIVLALLLALPLAAFGAPVGKISSLEGNVDITTGDKARNARPGDPVEVGDFLRAKSKAKAEVTFLDGNILRLAENTRVRITDYQSGEGKTSKLELFRGKTQNIVSGLAKNARYEVQTPTAICGVRGTDFIAFFQNGVSGFVPKEGTIYGFNRNMPQDVKVVTSGQAILVLAPNRPASVQPSTSGEVEKHVKDTAPSAKKTEEKKEPEKKTDGGSPSGTKGGGSSSSGSGSGSGTPSSGGSGTTSSTSSSSSQSDSGTGSSSSPSSSSTDSGASSSSSSSSSAAGDAGTGTASTASSTPSGDSGAGSAAAVAVTNSTATPTTTTPTTTTPTTTTTTTTTLPPAPQPQPVPTKAPIAFSGEFNEGHITKMVTGTLKGAEYTSLYRMPANAGDSGEFSLGPTNKFKKVRYQSFYFDDGIGTNRGFRREEAESLSTGVDMWGQTKFYRNSSNTTYWPNQIYLRTVYSGLRRIAEKGQIAQDRPNLNLAVDPTNGGGASANHPMFYGTLGSVSSFPADFTIGSPGTGTFVKTTDYSFSDINCQEEIGNFTGTLAVRSNDKMTLFASSSASSPLDISLSGSFTHDDGYGGAAFRGTVGYYGNFSKYVETTTGYGGAYYGQISGRLPDTGSTASLGGTLYALYIYNPSASVNKAGILTGSLTQGSDTTADPTDGSWKAEGKMYRLAAQEIDNASGVTAANMDGNIVNGRAVVEATTGFYNPTDAPKWTLGMGQGRISSINGIDQFGIFFLSHNLMNRSDNPLKEGVAWETAGWGEFGRYVRKDNPAKNYPDFGYWYASIDNKAWANNKLSGDFNGEFLTLKKYGTMTGQTGGIYEDSGVWNAKSQGYWLKTADLGFASEVSGKRIELQREQSRSYATAGGTGYTYNYSASDASEAKPYGRSSLYSPATGTGTIQRFEIQGPQDTYHQSTWTTADGGATWSYKDVYYADRASYLAAMDNQSTPPARYGPWVLSSSGDEYGLRDNSFDGIMGGLNANLWTDKTSPLRFLGRYDTMDRPRLAPSLSYSDIVSVNPLATLDPYSNSAMAIGGAYRGMFGIAVDSKNAVEGGLMALYARGATGGVLYSDDITGVVRPAVGVWSANGNLNLYQMVDNLDTGAVTAANFAGQVQLYDVTASFAAGGVPTTAISGGRMDLRTQQTKTLFIKGQGWGIWNNIAGGTYTGDAAGSPWVERWTTARETGTLSTNSSGGEYLNFHMEPPVQGVSSGKVAGAQTRLDEALTGSGSRSYTVVLGGNVKGLFDPATTPMTWSAISQGGYMETSAFMARQASLDDAARANLERAMKIPSFEVGMANLRGSDGNLNVAMDNVKFFRFQGEANPQLWATTNVAGTYTRNPGIGTQVPLNSSGDLSGLKHTFEVKQWNAGGNNNWGASVYRGTGDTGGTLTRSPVDAARSATGYLPAGAASTITINELRGGAAGTINTVTKSFTGTGSGTVR